MFKFLHAADIHLDSPLRGLGRYDDAPVDLLRGATRRAFENLVQAALDEGVAFVVIAGDLYDGTWRDINTGLFFTRQMGRLMEAGIDVFIALGNHDAESQLTRSLTVRLPARVHVFSTRKAERIVLDRLGVALHGRSFRERDTTENFVPDYPDPIVDAFNIGVLHTALEGYAEHASYAPCTLVELVNKGYQYWALGHVHSSQVLHRDPHVVFPGNLQGRTIRETGVKGAMLVTVDDGRVQALDALPLDVVRWVRVEVDATGLATAGAVEDRAHAAMEVACRDETGGRPLAARVTVHGATRAHIELLAREDAFRANLRALAAGMGADRLWVEKILIATTPEGAPLASGVASGGVDPVDELRQTLDRASDDAAFLEELRATLGEMWAKLPSDARSDLESGALAYLRDGRVDAILRDVAPYLVSRLAARSA